MIRAMNLPPAFMPDRNCGGGVGFDGVTVGLQNIFGQQGLDQIALRL
jgi:hypothetical protein